MTLLLGIESSCDETAAAVVEDGRLVRSNVVASQHDLHRKYRGVVPEIASRAHLERIMPVVTEAIDCAGTSLGDLNGVAVTNRPGLIGSLLVGVSAAKTLAWAAQLPLIGIDHIHAHLYAAHLQMEQVTNKPIGPRPTYPAIGLVVSGGHTSLYDLASATDINLLGRTIDDAVGEAYDKAAVILDAGYPGGPHLDALAQKGDPSSTRLPRSMLGPDSLDFSFSGLKTALLYAVRGQPQRQDERVVFERSAQDLSPQERADLAASFQTSAVETLILKLQRTFDKLLALGRPPRCLILGGGVSANSLLRRRTVQWGARCKLDVHLPPLALCLDNAAMIAGLAYPYFQMKRFDDLQLPAAAASAV